MPLSDDCVLIFDLDDTLYAERDFVRSGFRAISHCFDAVKQSQVFSQLEEFFEQRENDPIGAVLKQIKSKLSKDDLLTVYREHQPNLALESSVQEMLSKFKQAGHRLGLLTDGRSVTQRNKIKALGLNEWFDEIVVSEEFGSGKPDPRNYQHFEAVFPSDSFAYIGDNLTKDFITPIRMGWVTVALLDRGGNIHPQQPEATPTEYLPRYFIQKLA